LADVRAALLNFKKKEKKDAYHQTYKSCLKEGRKASVYISHEGGTTGDPASRCISGAGSACSGTGTTYDDGAVSTCDGTSVHGATDCDHSLYTCANTCCGATDCGARNGCPQWYVPPTSNAGHCYACGYVPIPSCWFTPMVVWSFFVL
jgi:hypothetical protein